MSKLVRLIPSLPTSVVAALFAYVLHFRLPAHRRLSTLWSLFWAVIVLNWRSLPFWWHVQIFRQIPSIHARLRLQGERKVFAIAKEPFDISTKRTYRATFDLCDWNGHLSNSSYAKILDRARFDFILHTVGKSMASGPAKLYGALAGSHFLFLKEIPILDYFEVESKFASWDDKWVYVISTFTTAGKGGARIVNTIAVQKLCMKLVTRLTVKPASVFLICGIGSGEDNWNAGEKLRKEGKDRAYLEWTGKEAARLRSGSMEETAGKEEGWDIDPLAKYEEQRVERLGYIHDTNDWSKLQ